MLGKILLISLLVVLSLQLRNQTAPTSGFPLISTVFFRQGEIFFVNKDRQGFGHIEKETGLFSLYWILESPDKILYQTEHQMLISNEQQLSQYLIFSKTQQVLASIKPNNVSTYEGYQQFKFGYYTFADGQLSLNQWKALQEDDQIINLQLDQGQQFRQLETFDQLLLVFTTSNQSICFTQVDKETVTRKKCINRISQSDVSIDISGKYIYVSYTNNKVQLLDKDFGLVQSFQEPVLQLSKGSATFAGFKTYDVQSRSFKDEKIVAHNHEGIPNTLVLAQGQYILKQGEVEVGKITGMSSDPVGLWLNKQQAAIGRVHGRYELLAQSPNGSLKLYEIRASEGTNSTVILAWSH